MYRLVCTGKGELKILQDPNHVRHTCPNKELKKKVRLHAQLRYSSEIRQAKSTEASIWTGAYLGVVLAMGFSYALKHKKAENLP